MFAEVAEDSLRQQSSVPHTPPRLSQTLTVALEADSRGLVKQGLRKFTSPRALLVPVLLTVGAIGAMPPAAEAQISTGIGIQPVCCYGYYDYAPYACAPVGFYDSGYSYNGIFLCMGPGAGWGYGHGWGEHRLVKDGGGRYHGSGGFAAGRA
jgi:hypothetical protein